MRRTLVFVILIPRNICIAVLRGYRALISPLYGDVCRYYPSCSSYALQAFQHYGVFRGFWLGTLRIARCHPWAPGGVDDVPHRETSGYVLTRFGFVLPTPGTRSIALLHHNDLTHSRGKG